MAGPAVPYTANQPQVAQLRASALIISGWNGADITSAVEYLAPLFLYGR